jgi:hypothetical protein
VAWPHQYFPEIWKIFFFVKKNFRKFFDLKKWRFLTLWWQAKCKYFFTKYEFARLCEGKCKPRRAKSHIPTKKVYLMRFSREAFIGSKTSKYWPCFRPFSWARATFTFRELYTTPSGLNSSQTPDIVSQRQRHGQVKSKNPTQFDAPAQAWNQTLIWSQICQVIWTDIDL